MAIYYVNGALLILNRAALYPCQRKSPFYNQAAKPVFFKLRYVRTSSIWDIVAQTVTDVTVTIYLSSFFSFGLFLSFASPSFFATFAVAKTKKTLCQSTEQQKRVFNWAVTIMSWHIHENLPTVYHIIACRVLVKDVN